MAWSDFRDDPHVRSVDDGGIPGYGGWRYPRSSWHPHGGIDLAVPVGTPVVAVEDGTAEYRSIDVTVGPWPRSAAGHRVRLRGRSGAVYEYFHLGGDEESTLDAFPDGIASGDKAEVKAGEVIGYSGFTGGSAVTGRSMPVEEAHLHFEYKPSGTSGPKENPALLFERVPFSVPVRSGGARD